MSDKKWDVIRTLILSAAIIVAAVILGNATKQAGWYIIEGLHGIGTSIASWQPQ